MREPVIGVVGFGRLGRAIAAHTKVIQLDSRSPHEWGEGPEVIVDCAAPEVTHQVIDLCHKLRVPLVECVSNLWPGHVERLTELARDVPVVRATNLAVGNYLQARVVDHLAELLGKLGVGLPEASVLERHPATKAHRPSATAVALADRWHTRTGQQASDIASLRAGPPVSDHEIHLGWPEQSLVVRHEVRSLDAAAAGAVTVARWVAGRAPGLYPVHAIYDDLVEANS
ncbi:4-hydroxy-tetrahydrodipicolinate reductase [Lentzea sp. NBRC 105346]|uniref:dihydrodipicolinate reductase C-terminal domain-containing protein n=1 Tax=Lentzea sp. NBRC 105346 TaxID=3032205 RepID=UPI0024A3E3EC|nr:dihydrodipicolinate reductase C-terminal domain-containing protein [Lentzea sp. NBRC 105346]GLZ29305.1 4-hydroxy-tetrahydrodipicolinate reductase [Lentzea sp. NBRC 105346]